MAKNPKTKTKNGSDEGNNNSGNGPTPDDLNRHGPIISDKEPSELHQDPYNISKVFEWFEVDSGGRCTTSCTADTTTAPSTPGSSSRSGSRAYRPA